MKGNFAIMTLDDWDCTTYDFNDLILLCLFVYMPFKTYLKSINKSVR